MFDILVLGSNGMLGTYIMEYFRRIPSFNVVGLTRKEFDAATDDVKHLDVHKYDVVINCIGTIKSVVDSVGTLNTILINSVFPHKLAVECETHNTRLIHITTDCVFDGATGHYSELDLHNPTDVYGKTKSLGEPLNAMVIRTSIIGEELQTKRSLIEWVKSNHNNTVNGYTNHTWNGVTCLELAKFIGGVIQNETYWTGIRHIFSPNEVTKLELVTMIAKAFNIKMSILHAETPVHVYRTLTSIYDHPIPRTLEEQINELPGFFK